MVTFECKCGRIVETDKKYSKICDKCKKPIIINGYSKCPKFLRLAYLRATNNTCQLCHKTFQDKDLNPVLINPKGKYTLVNLNSKENNILVVCNKCRKDKDL
jgi:hypothetical protein